MNKGAVVGAVAVGLIGAGIGATFLAKQVIKTGVATLFSEAAHSAFIDRLTYEDAQVDLLRNAITLTNVKTAMNIFGTGPGVLLTTGTLEESYKSVTITGVWELVMGGTILKTLDATQGAYTINMSQTLNKAAISNSRAGKNALQKGAQAVVNRTISGTVARVMGTDMDISTLLEGHPNFGQNMMPSAATYSADTIVFDVSTMVSPDMNRQKIPAVTLKYTIAHGFAKNISPQYLGLLGIQDITITATSPAANGPPMTLTVGEVKVTDTTLTNMIPVKSTYEIKGLVLDTSTIANPQISTTMAILGINEFNLDMKIAYDVNMAAHTFTLAPFKLGLKNVGSIELGLNISGVPSLEKLKILFYKVGAGNKAEKNLTFSELSLERITLGYQDAGILKKIMTAQAKQLTDGKVAPLAQAYAEQAARFIAITHGRQKAQDVQATLTRFLTDPKTIRIGLSSANPIKFSELSQAFSALGPKALNVFQLNVTQPYTKRNKD